MEFPCLQNFEVATCIGEVYAAVGSEEVSLAEGMLARMHEHAAANTPRAPHSKYSGLATTAEGIDDVEFTEDDRDSQFPAAQVRCSSEH